jgi:hypothetical protein
VTVVDPAFSPGVILANATTHPMQGVTFHDVVRRGTRREAPSAALHLHSPSQSHPQQPKGHVSGIEKR